MSCLYILGINPLLVASFAEYFLPFHRLLYYFIDGFLCCAKVFKFHQVPFVSINEYLGCFQVLAIVNSAAVNTRYMYFLNYTFLLCHFRHHSSDLCPSNVDRQWKFYTFSVFPVWLGISVL